MGRFSKSIVWEFFTKKYENNKVISVECKNCNANFKFCGNTTNLRSHLKRKHPIQLAEIETQENPKGNTDGDELLGSELCKQTQSTSNVEIISNQTITAENISSAPAAKKFKQMRLYGAIPKLELTTDERHEFEKDLVQMIAVDYDPLSIVEKRGFNSFVKKYLPRYKLPSRKVLSEVVLPEVYKSLSSELKGMLNFVENLSITTDMWSSDSNRSFLTVTAHFISDFQIYSSVLSTQEIITDHSGSNISEAINNILDKWETNEKVVTVVTDNAANMKKAVINDLKKPHHPCVAHTLNLLVQDAIKDNEELNKLLTKCRAIITYFKQSTKAVYKLREVQNQMRLQDLKLKKDVPTRWNSAVIMMERLLKVKSPLSAALSFFQAAPNNLDASEWAAIDDCVGVLKLFLSMTEELSGEKYPTVSRITPLIKGLNSRIKNKNVTTDIGKKLVTSLLKIIPKRLGFLETTKTVAISTFLDPRFKKAAFETLGNADKAEEWVIEELSELIQSVENCDNIDDPHPQNLATFVANTNDNDEDDLWWDFDKTISEISSTNTPTDTATMTVKQYLELPHLDRKKDPLEFWKLQKNTLPLLSKLASKYLSIPATSVPCERLFSKAAIITNERRNRLSPKKLDELLFISENAKFNI